MPLYFFRFSIVYFLRLIFKNLNSISIESFLINFVIWLCIATSTTAFSYDNLTIKGLANKKLNAPSINSTFIESKNNLLKFSQLSTSDGLSNSNVFGITQDNQGFIWFATEDGLNRFDGKNIVTYLHDAYNKNSIADNVIRKIFIDSQHTLWVGTQNGLSRYNIELDNFDNFTTKIDDEFSLRDNVIWDIYQNKSELIKNKTKPLLWISTTEGLHTLTVDSEIKNITFQRVKIKNYNDRIREIKTIFQDKQQNYWLGSYDNGIHLLSKNLTYLGSLKNQNKYDLTIDAEALFDIKIIDNQYWLATNNGLFIVDDRYQLVSHLTSTPPKKNTKQRLLSNKIRSIVQFDENHVWLATHEGLNIINLLNDEIESYQNNAQSTSLSENWLMDIFQDSNGSMWLASYGGGLNKYSPLTSLFHHGLTTKEGKSFRVGSFAETSDGTIWLSSEEQGLYAINIEGIIKKIDIPLNGNIRQVIANNTSHLWLQLTDNKIFKFSPAKNTLTKHSNWSTRSNYSTDSLLTIIKDDFWYLNELGVLTNYQTNKKKIISYPISNNDRIINFQLVGDSVLWILTENDKLLTFDIYEKTFINKKVKLPTTINDMYGKKLRVNKSWLWLGSSLQDLVLINIQTNQLKVFDESDGLPHTFISSILIDEKENAWLATHTGIVKINPFTKTVTSFDKDFSINKPEFLEYSALKSSMNQLFYGSPTGYYQFLPSEISQVTQKIEKPLFTNLYVANKKIKIKDSNQTSITNTKLSRTS